MFRIFRQAPRVAKQATQVRKMGGGHHGPDYVTNGLKHTDIIHSPEPYNSVGKGLLVLTFLWVFYRAKENKGQIFGLYYPWLDTHGHDDHDSHDDHPLPKFEFPPNRPELAGLTGYKRTIKLLELQESERANSQ